MSVPCYHFEGFELDLKRYELRRNGHVLKLEKIPMELLILLISRHSELVSREEIIDKLWGRDVFIETEHGINTAVRKIRQTLGDDPEHSRFVQTVFGKGYRFVAELGNGSTAGKLANGSQQHSAQGEEILAGTSDSAPAAATVTGTPSSNGAVSPWSASGHSSIHPGISQITEERPFPRGTFWKAFIALLLGLTVVLFLTFRPARSKPALTFVPVTSMPGSEGSPTLSPDGEQVAFEYLSDAGWDILTKRLDDEKTLRLTEPPGFSSCPSWSPDGKSIAYLRGVSGSGLRTRSGIYLMTPLGGAKRRLVEVENVSCQVTWSPDSRTLVYGPAWSATEPAGLFLVDIENPVPRRLLTSPSSALDASPAYSHDGKKIVFSRVTSLGTADLYVVASSGGEPTRLTYLNANLGRPIWTSDDQRIIFVAGTGWALDLYAIPASGGTPERLPFATHNEGAATISSDGTKLVYSQLQFDSNIWRTDLQTKATEARTFIASSRFENAPDFSPDGRRISFLSDRDGTQAIWICNADGSNATKVGVAKRNESVIPQGPNIPKWAPSGDLIAYDARSDGHMQVFVIAVDGGTPTQVTSGDFDSQMPSWSVDGDWIYFGSNRTGRYEVWRTSLKTRETTQVTKQGGYYGEESPDGKFVFFNKPRDDWATWTYVKDGIYSIPRDGGPEHLLIPEANWTWRAARDGIYYTDNNAKPRPVLKLFRFATAKTETLAVLNKESWGGPGGMAISPDGHTFLYAQIDNENKDLMLVKNGSW